MSSDIKTLFDSDADEVRDTSISSLSKDCSFCNKRDEKQKLGTKLSFVSQFESVPD